MFCSNCGRDCGDVEICKQCSRQASPLLQQKENTVTTHTGPRDLMYYFEQYQPNRPAAIKALRKDTNMSLIEAKRLIDQLFDEQTNKSGRSIPSAAQNLKFAIVTFGREHYNTEIETTQEQECDESIETEESCVQTQNNQEVITEGGTDFPEDHETPDYSHYYIQHRPDRLAAITAIRVDTGMGAVEAKRIIDALFDSKETGTKRRSESESVDDLKSRLDVVGKVYCPKCFSTKLFVHKESTTRAILYYRTAVFRLIGSIINLCYTLWGKRIEYVCLDCGHTWKK